VACSKLFSVFSVACSRLPDDLDESRNDARVVAAAWRATGSPKPRGTIHWMLEQFEGVAVTTGASIPTSSAIYPSIL
jgi:hypothetical protein